jgi:hypothetical protein
MVNDCTSGLLLLWSKDIFHIFDELIGMECVLAFPFSENANQDGDNLVD